RHPARRQTVSTWRSASRRVKQACWPFESSDPDGGLIRGLLRFTQRNGSKIAAYLRGNHRRLDRFWSKPSRLSRARLAGNQEMLMAELPAREAMEFDVVIVGAGPSGLASAIRLKQISPDISVVVVEKGSEVGAHILSGAVIDPVGLDRLLPD